jgi:hypothetical protein
MLDIDGHPRHRPTIVVILAAVLMFFASRNASAEICWQSGITPEGHSYRVLYVPHEAIQIAASETRHNYIAVAVAFSGWIWADASLPCRIIPWQHEMKHLDGWSHDANGRWTTKTDVAFAEGDRPRMPWTVVKTETDYAVVRGTELAALPD